MRLGLDISTSVIGVCLLDNSGAISLLSNIDLRKIEGTWEKADAVSAEMHNIANFSAQPITNIFIEQNLSKFRPGFSSASTLITLARFNGIVSYIAYKKFNLEPVYINVNEARKIVGVKIDKKDKIKSTKEKIFEQVQPMIPLAKWQYKTIKAGAKKGNIRLDDTSYDMADAWIVARAGLQLYP